MSLRWIRTFFTPMTHCLQTIYWPQSSMCYNSASIWDIDFGGEGGGRVVWKVCSGKGDGGGMIWEGEYLDMYDIGGDMQDFYLTAWCVCMAIPALARFKFLVVHPHAHSTVVTWTWHSPWMAQFSYFQTSWLSYLPHPPYPLASTHLTIRSETRLALFAFGICWGKNQSTISSNFSNFMLRKNSALTQTFLYAVFRDCHATPCSQVMISLLPPPYLEKRNL